MGRKDIFDDALDPVHAKARELWIANNRPEGGSRLFLAEAKGALALGRAGHQARQAREERSVSLIALFCFFLFSFFCFGVWHLTHV